MVRTGKLELKRAIVRTARRMLACGLVVGSLGNVSARDPQDAKIMHITPSGVPYRQMRPAELAEMTLDDKVLKGTPSSEWRLHAAIYRARPEARAVVHAHGLYAQAWSFLGKPLAARTEELEIFAGGEVRLAPYAPAGSQELADRAVAALRDRRAALLARHGIVAWGHSAEEALTLCQIVERQAHLAWLLRFDSASAGELK